MKSGATPNDRQAIKRMAADGASAAEISMAVQVDESVVKSFMPRKKRATKKKATSNGTDE